MAGLVYFAASAGEIKIGFTQQTVEHRLASIQTNLPRPFEVIGSLSGSYEFERAIHQHLVRYRLHGEWFLDCAETRASIKILLADGPLTIGFDPGQIVAANKKADPEGHLTEDQKYGARIARVAAVVWPQESLRKFAEFCEVDESVAREWFAGNGRPPRLTRMAFGSFVVIYAGTERQREFEASPRRSA